MRKWFTLLLIVLITIGLAACGGTTEDAGGESGDKVKVGLSMNTLNNPFFVTVKEGAEARAKEKGIELVVTDAQNDPGKQITDVENLLQQDLDVIIIDPADSDSIAQAVKRANEAGIPVFTIDRQSNGGEVITHIGFDAIKSGKIAGNYLVEALGGKGKVIEIQGILGTNVAQDRSAGFNSVLEENPGMELIAQQSANFDQAEALKVMEDLLQAHDDIDAIYAANDNMALGALKAIEAAGRLDEIILIGCDAVDPALQAIRDEKIEATIAEPPFFLGSEAIDTALKILDGEEIEKSIILDSTLVTLDNIDEVKTR